MTLSRWQVTCMVRQPNGGQDGGRDDLGPDQDDGTILRGAYDQLCMSYRAIDDFRTKLLGFLPLVTGGGLLLLTGKADGFAREFLLHGSVRADGDPRPLAYEI
jgi:hypothetical protein